MNKEPDIKKPSKAEAEEAVRTLIKWAGDDPTREGLLGTPDRGVRAYEEFFHGYTEDPTVVLGRTLRKHQIMMKWWY